jgi:hypothetical protein
VPYKGWRWRSCDEPLRDRDIPDLDRDRPSRNEARQQRKSGSAALGLNAPPDRMSAGKARRFGVGLAKRALKADPGGECGCAFRRGVLVLEEVRRHTVSLLHSATADIGDDP